jgi:hypothetical protein
VNDGSNGILGSDNPGYCNSAGYCNTTGNGSLPGGEFATFVMLELSQSGPAPGAIQNFTVKVHGETADFKSNAATGAPGYVVEIAHAGPVNGIQTAYITKDTKLTIEHLPSIPANTNNVYYEAYLYPFNVSGSNINVPSVSFPLCSLCLCGAISLPDEI